MKQFVLTLIKNKISHIVWRNDHGDAVTSSPMVALLLDKDHQQVLTMIQRLMHDREIAPLAFRAVHFYDAQQRPQRIYEMDRRACAMLIMAFPGESVVTATAFRDAFTLVEDRLPELENWPTVALVQLYIAGQMGCWAGLIARWVKGWQHGLRGKP